MAGGRKHRVLIADESITIQKLVHIGLAGSTFEVIAASDGPDALQKVKTLKPELVLVDSALRRTSGLEVVDQIRGDSALTKTRVVLLTGKLTRDEEAKAKKTLADEVLAKPFDAKTLLDLVHRLVLDEESEDETPIVKVHPPSQGEDLPKIEKINRRLKDAVESVKNEPLTDEDTAKVRPEDFKQPVKTDAVRAESAPPVQGAAPVSDEKLEALVKTEVQAWLQTNLAPLAERLLKEEISKLTKNS